MSETPAYLIVGAGLTGAVIARVLADAGLHCHVLEEHRHVGGHCHTERDAVTGILMNRYGPHTLHSDKPEIWNFVERFVEIFPYQHRKQAWAGGRLFPFPINLATLRQFFGQDFTPDSAREFLRAEAEPLARSPANFEEAALASVGRKLYDAFFRGYTLKHWGRDPTQLPASIFARVPVHFDAARNVYHHARQGQPVGGYTHLVERMLDHPNVRVEIGRPFNDAAQHVGYRHVFYSGPIDRYFGWRFGRLAYRTLDFRHERSVGEYQQCGTVNHCDLAVPHTRVAEHKHFFAWERHEETIYSFEYSRECGANDTPFYPVQLARDEDRFLEYVRLARNETNTSFVGRLGTYRYIDMDAAIDEAIAAAKHTLDALRTGAQLPALFADPARVELSAGTESTRPEERV